MKNNLSTISYTVFIGLFILWGCQPIEKTATEHSAASDIEVNPPANGFDLVNSHPVAIEIADQVMEAMGGRGAWDSTRYISWDFFGARRLIWDKLSGNVRIDFPDSTVYLVNINDGSGKVHKHGNELINPDSLAKELDRAKRIWINDSYWLVMPFKLKDTGVTLKHLGSDQTLEGTPSYVLELTFKEVGVTPQNRYYVYVDTATNLVNQWAFFREAEQDTANWILPWRNYQEYGKILLADNRGERSLTNVSVFASLPDEVFTTFDQVDLENYN